MSSYSTNEFKSGLKVMLDGDPCSIIENEFVKPGKGQAFNRVKLRNLKTGRVIEKTFKSGDTLNGADVADIEVQYLYSDGDQWYFMDPINYEQYAASATAVSLAKPWLKGQDICMLTLFNGVPLSVIPPTFVTLRITHTEPGIRGDTTGRAEKPATLETGAVVRVPLFVENGELIKVDTRTNEYVSRIKE